MDADLAMNLCGLCGTIFSPATFHSCRKEEFPDQVDHPPHYNQGSIEAIQAIEAALGPEGFVAYCLGNDIKYVWRSRYKGKELEDLKKARWYLDRAISTLEATSGVT